MLLTGITSSIGGGDIGQNLKYLRNLTRTNECGRLLIVTNGVDFLITFFDTRLDTGLR